MALRNLFVLISCAWIAHISATPACFAEPAAVEAAPFTMLYDTGTASAAPLVADALGAIKGWTVVPEDNLTRPFTGDAVFMNDRVAVVLRRNSNGAEIYSKALGPARQRVSLIPLGIDGAAGTFSSVKIIENSQAAVMLEAAYTSKAGAIATFRFRLTAGEALLDVRGGPGAGRLRVCDRASYVVVPDFFADDMVFDPATHVGARIGLPAENSVLGLTDDGKAIVACVWPSSRQNVDLLLAGEGSARTIAGYEIDLPAESRLWIAAMEGAGIWHARRMTDGKLTGDLALDWKPPMSAHWRADFAAADGMAISCYFADPDAGATPENVRSDGRCRFDAGRALVRSVDTVAGTSAHLVVVYPVERTRTTPLTAFCLVDIMRNALGVGPCQYVLDTERIGAADNPTPEPVTHWVESQFEKKPSKRDADTIREQLAKMTQQMKRTDARIGDYITFGQKVKQACAEHATSAENAAAASRLAALVETIAAPPSGAMATAEKLAADVAAQAEQPDALTKTQSATAAIRAAGLAQDNALAKNRMAARRLKQEARTLAGANPRDAAFANQVQQMAEQMLVKK